MIPIARTPARARKLFRQLTADNNAPPIPVKNQNGKNILTLMLATRGNKNYYRLNQRQRLIAEIEAANTDTTEGFDRLCSESKRQWMVVADAYMDTAYMITNGKYAGDWKELSNSKTYQSAVSFYQSFDFGGDKHWLDCVHGFASLLYAKEEERRMVLCANWRRVTESQRADNRRKWKGYDIEMAMSKNFRKYKKETEKTADAWQKWDRNVKPVNWYELPDVLQQGHPFIIRTLNKHWRHHVSARVYKAPDEAEEMAQTWNDMFLNTSVRTYHYVDTVEVK